MRRLLLLAALGALTISPSDALAQRGEGRRSDRAVDAPKLEHYTIVEGRFATDLLAGGEARYYVLLPQGHDADADRTWPWVLWLPGFGGASDFLQRGGAERLDALRGAGSIPELAVVVYRGAGRRSVYMNGEGAGKTENLITGPLLDHVHEKYRLSKDRAKRAVMGVSAGGFGALKIAMRHPDKFAAVAAHSSAILPADPAELEGMYEGMVNRMLRRGLGDTLGDPIDPAKWAEHMPMGLAEQREPAELQGLQIYFAAGTEDNYGFFPANEKLAAVMQQRGHKHLFHAVEQGGHAWSSPPMVASVAVSLRFVGDALSGKDAIATTQERIAAERAAKAKAAEQAKQKAGGDDR